VAPSSSDTAHRTPGRTRLHLHRSVLLTTVVLVLATSCSSDGDGASTTSSTSTTLVTTTTAATTTTTEGTTTTAAPATTTTGSETTTTTRAPTTTTTSTPDTNSLASGSGCTPGTTTSLPDGEWFGYVDDASAARLSFDLACWFTGDAAAQAAAEDGEESPPPNDYYVRNVNPGLRTLSVAGSATVAWLPNPGDPSTATVPYADWLTDRTARSYQPGVWLTITGGAITTIEEQYVP
jgi:hypothetical protein